MIVKEILVLSIAYRELSPPHFVAPITLTPYLDSYQQPYLTGLHRYHQKLPLFFMTSASPTRPLKVHLRYEFRA
jgi:hypothetical protein